MYYWRGCLCKYQRFVLGLRIVNCFCRFLKVVNMFTFLEWLGVRSVGVGYVIRDYRGNDELFFFLAGCFWNV